MFKKLFNESASESERKSIFSNDYHSCYLGLDPTFSYNESELQFINYYIESSPVFTATRLIANTASSIKIVIYDKKKDQVIYEHPALDLLKRPNPFTPERLFFKELYSYYVLTGNTYLNITGSGKPVELNVLNPSDINIEPNYKDGYAEEYRFNSNHSSSLSYKRDRDYRFIAQNGNEITHIKDFNPKRGKLIGLSTFAGVQLAISKHILASIHNNSLLKNGGRPSGLMSYKGDQGSLSPEQASKINEAIQSKLSGAANAGKTIFVGANFDWQPLSESMKDMDFQNLEQSSAEAIFNAAQVPLPMISPDNMTLANMDTSKYIFFDNCVLPLVKTINSHLTKSVLHRYSNSENLEFAYDESDIETLEFRKTENTINLYQNGLISLDEARTEIGYEAIDGDGGDLFYKPSNMIPIGTDSYTRNERSTPAKSAEKAEYIRLMSQQTDLKGNRLYSDQYIKKNVDTYYN